MKKSTVARRNGLIVFLILLLTLCAGCYPAYKSYFTDTSKYGDIWKLAGFQTNAVSGESIFPRDISGLDVEEFFCRYDEQLPLGEGIQILLKVRFDSETDFLAEADRVQAMSKDCGGYFRNKEYSFYATHFAESGFFEYAAIPPEDRSISYIYIQYLPRGELEIEDAFIPAGYTDYGEIKSRE